ncbi:Hypothetical predicted protein [Podarcis lilfordi]|uniref:Uncharacterized protein n=1 Tax=Podarcis lilfordi TaxID=74358 RepID=A0AA35JRY9_9SAUR|nr:Hypothetical predicted protein [Podarcis lilfordi]
MEEGGVGRKEGKFPSPRFARPRPASPSPSNFKIRNMRSTTLRSSVYVWKEANVRKRKRSKDLPAAALNTECLAPGSHDHLSRVSLNPQPRAGAGEAQRGGSRLAPSAPAVPRRPSHSYQAPFSPAVSGLRRPTHRRLTLSSSFPSA